MQTSLTALVLIDIPMIILFTFGFILAGNFPQKLLFDRNDFLVRFSDQSHF
ncbi:protein of unknown function [Maridesulfovibrio hydrothermalis AM13 = DSM 14728]|uniref:Uncharacterized protein n=1 Tax=Maridesulfovibrio hydrothermalis AM13 = DSM 14728 TaxID=1121451 RepID=L0RE44_9BACT|nr:protein of unknown function [Maridesulfovibrio hydrothermalis AM13 = DSM 14728]